MVNFTLTILAFSFCYLVFSSNSKNLCWFSHPFTAITLAIRSRGQEDTDGGAPLAHSAVHTTGMIPVHRETRKSLVKTEPGVGIKLRTCRHMKFIFISIRTAYLASLHARLSKQMPQHRCFVGIISGVWALRD